jgi:kynureninase
MAFAPRSHVRGPDSILLGLPPLYTRFTAVYDAFERLRDLVERGEHRLVQASRLRVTWRR